MTEQPMTVSRASVATDSNRVAWMLPALVALLALVYFPILRNLIENWRLVPDYSHGFLIVPLAAFFAYEKRRELTRAKLGGSWWGIVLLALGYLSLALGQLGTLLTALRTAFVLGLMGLVLLLAGKQIFRILLFPMSFLMLMIPIPQSLVNSLTFPLQLIAARWAVAALQAIHIPALLEGNIIHLARTSLFVAEACSGLRSIMALLTLGVVFSHFFRRGHRVQQLALIVSTLPIAIFVNALRVALTGFLTHHWGHDAAGGFIHDFQGMITFGVSFMLLLAEARLLESITADRTVAGPAPDGSA